MDRYLPAVLAVSPPTPGSAATLADYADDIRLLLGASRSANTLRAYRSDLRQFVRFCAAHHLPQALPVAPYVVASFISWMAQRRLKASTIGRRLAALAALHRRAGCDDPTGSPLVVQTMEGLRRTRAFEGERAERVQPIEVAMLRQIQGCLSQSTVDARDWAIVLLGFAALLLRPPQIAKRGWRRSMSAMSNGVRTAWCCTSAAPRPIRRGRAPSSACPAVATRHCVRSRR